MAENKHYVVQEVAGICADEAAKYNVVPYIHPEDFIFHFLIENPCFNNDRDAAVKYYFQDGFKSAQKLRGLLSDFCGSSKSRIQLLEFASGYGCVTRHFSNVFPEVDVTSCDIHVKAVNFIKDVIGKSAILSDAVPEKLITPEKYDVIFALSFFSHMPRVTWGRWLNVLMSKLKGGGCLLFTTHGMESRKYFNYPQVSSEGFWFWNQSEQKDLDTNEYGQTIVLPKFVLGQISDENETRIIFFREAYWWDHQDIYILKRV
ncbi:MAG: hypothetical protein A2Y66_00495 [Nitrospirae bacterium RBG_13_41_22]|nr:MAG: hypothetical protein A2Y66_00495 [Nitrospirae bacterium RBG_13_41_22]